MALRRIAPGQMVLRPVLAIAVLVLAGAAIAPSAVGRSTNARAHAAGSYLTGIGDQSGEMFSNQLWQRLHTKIARYIAPYDAAVRRDELNRAKAWIYAAKAKHQQVLVAFYHSEHTPTRMPSVATYQHDVQKFVKDFREVKLYQSWDESNRGNVPGYFSSPSAYQAAEYYQALKRSCLPCTVIGLDVLDQYYIGPTLTYISEFKHAIGKLHTLMPSIWGLHNYSDVNRLESWRTRELVRVLGGQVWLTETGGIVKFGGAFPNNRGSGLARAARVLKYMFAVASSVPGIKRLYIYDWRGGTASTRFDAGLMNVHYQPRAGYVVVCRQLHASQCGTVRVARN
jgi:hypothetical protein